MVVRGIQGGLRAGLGRGLNPAWGAVGNPDLLLRLDFTGTSKPAALDTYSRASNAYPVTGDGAGGLEVTEFGSGVYAYGYGAGFSHASKTAMLDETARVNLCTYSEDFTDASWAKTGVTVTGNQAQSPRNTLTADEVSFPATANQFLQYTLASVGAGDFCHTVFMRAKSGTATVDLIHVDGSTIDQTEVCNLTEDWQRFETANSNGATTDRLRISNGAHGAQEIYVWGAQIELALTPSSYIPTSGGTAARVATDWQASNLVANNYFDAEYGELRTVVMSINGNDGSVDVAVKGQVGARNDRRIVPNVGTGVRLYDGGGTLVFTAGAGNPARETERDYRMGWDKDGGIEGTKRVLFLQDGVEVNSFGGTQTASADECDLKSVSTNGNQLVATIEIFDQWQG